MDAFGGSILFAAIVNYLLLKLFVLDDHNT